MYYGINNAANHGYGVAAALTYWVFKCRGRSSPANGTKTWVYLESAIRNAAEVSTCLEDYLQRLCDSLHSHLRPEVLNRIIRPQMRVLRVAQDFSEIQEVNEDQQNLQFMGWRDLLTDIAPHGFTEWDVLELCRSKPAIIQVLCRLRFEEDRALGKQNDDEETLDVDVSYA